MTHVTVAAVRFAIGSGVILLGAFFSAPAFGFADPTQFLDRASMAHAATSSASGEGIYFTGAPRFSHMTCATCHIPSARRARMKLGANPESLFKDGYLPGAVYELELELLGEWRGVEHNGPPSCTEVPTRGDRFTYVQCNNNSFALEIDDAHGAERGRFCAAQPVNGLCPAADPVNDESWVAPDGDAVFGNRGHDVNQAKLVVRNDPTRWHLWWTAPPAGTGAVTVYAAIVDGNGGDGTIANDQDPYLDDTVEARLILPEHGVPVRAACSMGSPAHSSSWLLIALLMSLIVSIRLLFRRAQ